MLLNAILFFQVNNKGWLVLHPARSWFPQCWTFNIGEINCSQDTGTSGWPAVFIWYCKLSALHHCTSVFQCARPWNVFDHGIEQFPPHLWPICQRLFAPLPISISTVNLVWRVPGRLCGDSWLDCRVFHPWEHLHSGHSGGCCISQAPICHTARCNC